MASNSQHEFLYSLGISLLTISESEAMPGNLRLVNTDLTGIVWIKLAPKCVGVNNTLRLNRCNILPLPVI